MNYNKDYFIASPDFDIHKYEILPEKSSIQRRFHYRKLNFGEAPVSFSLEDERLLALFPPMLFCTPSFFVSEDIKNIFDDKIYSGQLYPALINGKKGYYLLNIFDELDCWDRENSIYEQDDIDDDPHVIKYSLNNDVLNSIPEKERMIFKMGGDDLAPLIVHKDIKKILEKKVDYLKFFMIENYELGDEY